MARVKRGTKRTDRRKKILARAKGYYGTHSKSHRIAKQAVDKALLFAYRDRRQKKRQLRALWIVRINAAARLHGLSYSRLIAGLRAVGSLLDRKVLAELAVRDAPAFAGLAAAARQALAAAEKETPAPAEAPPAAAAGAGTTPPAIAQGH
ncbi:MAG: 50S ribosomal protein L20 [Acidobacteria bacterium]|nr:50S ribosomal protein L20 [Acidobacteriota bacterium]